MAGVTEYTQPLRAIGQALEVLNIQSFEMEPVGEAFIIRASVPGASKRRTARSGAAELQAIQDEISNPNDAADPPHKQSGSGVLTQIDLRYSLREIDLLEKEGRSHRGDFVKPADASSLSQVLRCIGGYLQQKCARLLKVTRALDSVSVEYETSLGSKMKETFAVRDLYDLWVRMYLQRQGRTSDR
ncbi:MAG: hypothetical protein ACREQ2_25895 [Candidatus Binatia bacterium]